MEKIITVLLCLLLCSCNYKSAACYKYDGNNEIEVYIEAVNDDIESIRITEVFELPYDLLANEKEFVNFTAKLDQSYHFEDNRLIRQYGAVLDKTYSFNKTIDRLKKEKYSCE